METSTSKLVCNRFAPALRVPEVRLFPFRCHLCPTHNPAIYDVHKSANIQTPGPMRGKVYEDGYK